MVDSDHGFHNFVKIPGNYNAFFHVLLTPWPQKFTGSGAAVRFPCYEVHIVSCLIHQRRTMWELLVKFYLGQNEKCRYLSEIALRDHSKEAVMEGQYRRLCWRRSSVQFSSIKHAFYKRFSASHQELLSAWRDLMFLLLF